MRAKTFWVTYLLFLCILFSSLGIVSVYLTNSQTDLLKEKSVRDYHAIAATLSKDIAVLYGRGGINVAESVNTLVNGYASYYGRYGIDIEVADLSWEGTESYTDAVISFVRREQNHYVRVSGTLPAPFQHYRFDYGLDVTSDLRDMQNIQRTLMLFAVIFSFVTAIALYFILSGVFRPLGIVADISRKIANGQYGERIYVKGKHELASMASDFNRMAEIIERQIRDLADEAVGKQRFVDNFAHEIRTPLTSILGYAEYLQKVSLDEAEIIESAQFIVDEAGHMKHIANSLLALATLRHYSPAKDSISAARLFDDIGRSLEKPLRERGVRLHRRGGAHVLYGQEDLIKSLLINLCDNAMKSCAPGTGEIHLLAENQGGHTVVSVTDNGCGMPPESVARVTEPFYRVDQSRSRGHGGAGLGLALCRQITEAHGAGMTVESVLGVGTTVKITFTSS